MLHPVTGVPKGRTRWCGPSALSIITGQRYDGLMLLLKAISGRGRIKGVSHALMSRALDSMGWTMLRQPIPAATGRLPETLAAWLRQRTSDQMDRTYLLSISKRKPHYVVVRARKVADGKVGAPVWLKDFPQRRARGAQPNPASAREGVRGTPIRAAAVRGKK